MSLKHPCGNHFKLHRNPKIETNITSGTNLTIMFNLLLFFQDFHPMAGGFVAPGSPSCRNSAQSSLLAGRLRQVASGMHAWQIGNAGVLEALQIHMQMIG